jgi:hypothetical protein
LEQERSRSPTQGSHQRGSTASPPRGLWPLKPTDIVARHGYRPSDLGEINQARLYERHHPDGARTLLCVQKIGQRFRLDRQAFTAVPGLGVRPLGAGVAKAIIPCDALEAYLAAVFAQAMAR